MTRTRRFLLAAPVLLPIATAPFRAGAQAHRTLRLVVPFPAGGATDGLARLWAPGFGQRLGMPVVIDNRPGAGGVPAADLVAKAAPDGLTLLLATSSIASTGPAVNPSLPYEVERDFTPLSLLAVSPSLVLVSAAVPAPTLEEFIAWARARRGAVNYGSSGVGTGPHLAGALFDRLADTGMVHVPYRGTGPVYAELRRGDVHALFDVPSTAAPHLQGGTVRALAVTSPGPTPLAPGLPSANAVVPGFEAETWFGVYGPAGLAGPLKAQLAAAAAEAVRDPALTERFAGLGAEVRGGDGAVLAAAARDEREKWTRLVRDLGIKPEG
jgi:tripartite-type tricarboxylate transporter receptor subunit TctC